MSNTTERPSHYLPLASVLGILVLWQLLSSFSGWSEDVLPGPWAVAGAFGELLGDGSLIKHSVASLYRVTLGFYIAVLLGIPLGILIGRMATLRAAVDPIINFMRPISPLAWIPLAMLWFGIGDKPAVFLIFLSSFFPLVTSTAVAVRRINPTYFQVGANFCFSSQEILTKVIIPAITPDVFTALRISVSIAWLVVVAAEMIAVQSGLGYLILDARNGLRMDYVMVGMIVIGLIGVLLDHLMLQLSRMESMAWRGRV